MNAGDEITYQGKRYLVVSSGSTVHDIRDGRPVVGLITRLHPLDGGEDRMILHTEKELA